ncbi:hypothetical protein [Eubacterium barkeri]|uniref:SipW-cognate class signal peptide n=1 Tax=Eubacterium barkeri TaxID=1528 RepID=A0A1H3GVG6_EUBBA|nr:hypothetical protein [Eubacterium barkeri]SDY07322.1 hypothetical protein SAMN04488579_11547 [Eubacterium barkeri]
MKLKIMVMVGLLCALCATPALAQDLTNLTPSGSTEVTGVVSNQNPGGVSYIIAIPDKVDFGTIQQPGDNQTTHHKDVTFTVSATEITNLTQGQVAVLMKDGTGDGVTDFRIHGKDTVNTGKSLKYSVLDNAKNDIQTGTDYPNGNLIATFKATGNTVNGTLRLDQNQLFMEDLTKWAGNFSGTINFYSTVVTVDDIN